MSSLKHPVRIVTAASLFDGHDASINIMRRMLQDFGAEVIHLGHNRSVMDIVTAALQEGAQAICVSSYQGGHMEFFKYMKDLLVAFGADYVKIFGGGGGVIVHDEKRELEDYGIDQIFHPDDGRRLGLDGMIRQVVEAADFDVVEAANASLKKGGPQLKEQHRAALSTLEEHTIEIRRNDRIRGLELCALESKEKLNVPRVTRPTSGRRPLVLGMTGTGGAGKSSLIDELSHRFLNAFDKVNVGIFCVDPTKRKTGGALLGDRIRMNSLSRPGTFMRSIASRGSGREVSDSLPQILKWAASENFDIVIAETSGIGQGNTAITEVADLSLYVMTSEFGAQSQLEKIDMIDYAHVIAINKADRRGSQDALRDVRKQYRRSRQLFHEPKDELLPIFLTQASQFNDAGVNGLFFRICEELTKKDDPRFVLTPEQKQRFLNATQSQLIPPHRQNYLAEIARTVREYKSQTEVDAEALSQIQAVEKTKELASGVRAELHRIQESLSGKLGEETLCAPETFRALTRDYAQDSLTYEIRGKKLHQPLIRKSLSGLSVRRVAVPRLTDWGDQYRYLRLENVPGRFPYTAGVFELKRDEEEPRRQFAGEGAPARTNRRFHFLSQNDTAKRLSTAFDSVTLYGEDPALRPDIYGKVGESGVSICTLQDMQRLYHGFDLLSPSTSVSMTINGPAPIILAFFLNTAIDQVVEKKEKELGRLLTPEEWNDCRKVALTSVRGTVQADILKEDQAQNTCIFSLDFALKMMGDVQEFFIQEAVRNFYSVSISGYHIAEAGANPISQLAFTLSNGFTYVEYYLARGMKIDDFAPNLSFFFSNGLDPEYSVLGRVARRIWAVAMKTRYGANDRSQKLKYHIQTSGRSLHAQEIDFNDIRTTLQALIAIYDHCNSLHTNAYDEAITTPTEESVRRAMAVQMIVNREMGTTKNENPTQGAYFIQELTELVEEAVLDLFLRINERGGVLGAMETQFQRSQIQEESLYYERLKHTGELPLIGVNTFVDPKTQAVDFVPPKIELARASQEEKNYQLTELKAWQGANADRVKEQLENLKAVALKGGNIFGALMKASRFCSLGQMSSALYEVGGQYRRNI